MQYTGGDHVKKIKVILERLKNPIVLISIVSQILIILSVFKTNIDTDLVTKVMLAIGSILVSLGIVNNPSKETIHTEFLYCRHCKRYTNHILINGRYICEECGNAYEGDKILPKKTNRLIK